jgi:hypothetical protein
MKVVHRVERDGADAGKHLPALALCTAGADDVRRPLAELPVATPRIVR